MKKGSSTALLLALIWFNASGSEAAGRANLAVGVMAAGAAAGAAMLDSPARRPTGGVEYGEPPGLFAGEGSAVDRLGRPETQFAFAGLAYGIGRLSGSPRLKRVGLVGAGALATTGLATFGLKSASGRSRPFVGEGPAQWRGFGGGGNEHASFPSGHTAMAFTMASVAAEELPWSGDLAVYGLATAVGASRIHQDQHWATDVLAGAALGWAIGKGFSRLEKRTNWARGAPSGFVISGRGLYFTKKF